MMLAQRLKRLEAEHAKGSIGPRRCRVCGDGARLGCVTLVNGLADWAGRGPTTGCRSCPACGRRNENVASVVGIDPGAL